MPDGIFNESMGQGIIFSLLMFSFVLLLLLLFVLVIKRVGTYVYIGKERNLVSFITITIMGVTKSEKLWWTKAHWTD